MSGEVSIREGSIYLPHQLVDTYFRDIDAVIVLIQQGELMVMPVHQATSGGSLLKVKNMLDFRTDNLAVNWNAEKSALCAMLGDN